MVNSKIILFIIIALFCICFASVLATAAIYNEDEKTFVSIFKKASEEEFEISTESVPTTQKSVKNSNVTSKSAVTTPDSVTKNNSAKSNRRRKVKKRNKNKVKLITTSETTTTETVTKNQTTQKEELVEKSNEENVPKQPPVGDVKAINENDLELLARVMYHEARDYSDQLQQYVGQVVLNRVKSSVFPNTVAEVLSQPGQYPGATDIVPSEMAYKNAKKLLEGTSEYGSQMPENVVYQANFTQGTSTFAIINIQTEWYSSIMYFCS